MDENELVTSSKYKEYLSTIWNGQWGSENRSPIHETSRMLSEVLDTDISDELETIASAVKGEDMRVAIYNALYKLNQAKEEPGPDSGVTVDDLYSTGSYVEGNGEISPIRITELTGKDVKWCCGTCVIGASASSGSVYAVPEENGLALLFVAARSALQPTVAQSDEWELVVNGERTSSTGFGFDVYKKTVTGGSSIYATIEKSGAYEAYAMLCVEYGASGVSVVDDVRWTEDSFTPTAKTSNRRIYAAAAPNTGIQYTPAVIFEESDGLDLKRINVKNQVFLAHDYQNGVNSTPNLEWGLSTAFSSGNVTSLTLDILEG